MPEPRRVSFIAGTILFGLSILVGCVRRQTDAFPWGDALQARGAASAEVAGTYQNVGQVTWAPGAPTHLFGLFFEVPPPVGSPKELKIRLQVEGTDRIRAEALRNGRVVASRVLTLARVPDDGSGRGAAWRLEKKSEKGATNLGVGWGSGHVQLRRGADGCLYGESRASGGGLLFYAVPYYGSATNWMRWEPAAKD